MRCASYVRTTCYDPTVDVGSSPMSDQRGRIREFVRKHHWRISNRYSDRLRDRKMNDGFQEFKRDALNRTFDCIIADSIFYLGADVYQTIHFLKKSYCPAGLEFAFVDDDFYSGEHTSEEIYKYLNDKRTEINGIMAKVRMQESSVESYFSVYGFRYYKDEHRVEVEPHAVEIIREIYERLSKGEKPQSIADDLTSRGEESPSDYFCKQRGWPLRRSGREWNNKSIRTISTNTKYIGKWDCSYDPEKLQINCGAIVDPELFEKVQQITHDRYYQLPTKRLPSPYANLMWDKESGMKIHYFNNTRTKHSDVRFKYPKEKDIKYERAYMPYAEFHEKAQDALLQEKLVCENVLRMLNTEMSKAWIAGRMQDMQSEFPGLLSQMQSLENIRMDAYGKYSSGDLSEEEYKSIEAEITRQLSEVDVKTMRLYERIRKFNLSYSEDNPWIHLFSTFDETRKLTRKYAIRYVDKLLIYRFESVELVPREREWRDVFPAEWLEVEWDG